MFNLLTISISDSRVYIRGFSRHSLLSDIARSQGDWRFSNNIFQSILGGVWFPEFYLPDVFYILQKLTQSKSPPVRIRAARLAQLILDNTWIGQNDTSQPRLQLDRLKDLEYKPLEHQSEFFDYYSTRLTPLRLNGTLLAAQPGLGKTYMGLAIAHCLQASRVVIISPLPAVTRVWEDQILKVFKPNSRPSFWTSQLNRPYNSETIAVYHYEALSKAMDDIRKLESQNVVIILDECHNLNELKSARTQNFLSLAKQLRSKNILFMSGTPIKAMGSELVPMLKAIDPLFNTEAEIAYKKVFGFNNPQNAELLKSRLGQISFFIDKAVINLARPNMIDLRIRVPNSEEFTLPAISEVMTAFIKDRKAYYKERQADDEEFFENCCGAYLQSCRGDTVLMAEYFQYRQYITDIQAAYKSLRLSEVKEQMEFCNRFENRRILPILPSAESRAQFKDVKSIIKYVGLKIQGECLGRIVGGIRIQAHVAMAAVIDYPTIVDEADLKTVIFSSYTEVCDKALERLQSLKYKPLAVYGSSTKSLSAIVSKFEKDDDANPLVATYASLSTAVPLIMANTMIMINVPFRGYIQEQAIARIHRLGTRYPTFVYTCILDTGDIPNISTRGVDILKWSQEQVEQLTGMENVFKSSTTVTDGDVLTVANESLDISDTVSFAPQMKKHFINNW